MKEKSISLIVPVYNGEKFIQESVKEYNKAFSKVFKKLEIIVVCNACTDNTEQACLQLKQETKIPIKVVNEPRRGKGNALSNGFNHAQYEIIGFIDADNPFDLNEILKMISILEDKETDMVIVTKFKKGRFKQQTVVHRRIFSLGGSLVARFFLGLNFLDTQAGAKFMKKTLWDNINKNFVCSGFEFDMELLYEAQKAKAKIKEYFLLPKESDFSTVKMRILPGIIYRLLKMRLLK